MATCDITCSDDAGGNKGCQTYVKIMRDSLVHR